MAEPRRGRFALAFAALLGVAFAAHARGKPGAPVFTMQVTTEGGQPAVLATRPDDPWRGAAKPKVAVVQFGDLECGYCKRMFAETSRLYEVYGDVAAFWFESFPLNPDCNAGVVNRLHKNACQATAAAECARQQGRFWSFAAIAFHNQHALGDDMLALYARKAGLDEGAFQACFTSPATMDAVRRTAELGTSLGMHGTPRVFIDGQLYRSGSVVELGQAIEAALGPSLRSSRLDQLTAPPPSPGALPAVLPPMQRVARADGEFSIDTFEDAVEDGRATVGVHQVPARVTWFEARDACAAAGKRLCTEAEWVSACQGAPAVDDDGDGEVADDMIEGTAYPYGDDYDDGRCWSAQPADARPVYTGEMPACVGPAGVYDLTGNVEEWAGATPETAVLLGGAYDTTEDHARCYRRNDTFGPGYRNPRTGFRCCADPSP